ncbi:MAG: hypothetical protein A2Y14_02495 [Verrucomicrobia bacterium GWF2_51_19]|nr:MAG: hypothetical protein A2Y14_02495 [Verrucomicrobia bacterium GWF2_51_19]
MIPSKQHISTIAKKIAQKKGLDLASLKGTGPAGRILRTDVEKMALPNSILLPQHTHMEPCFYLTIDVACEELLAFQAKVNQKLADSEKITLPECVLKAAAVALADVSEINPSPDNGVNIRWINRSTTAVIDGADKKSLRTLSLEAKDLAKINTAPFKASELLSKTTAEVIGKTAVDVLFKSNELIAGLSIRVWDFPNINAFFTPPNTLSIGALQSRPVVKNNTVQPGNVLTLGFTGDTNTAAAARFLSKIKSLLENPIEMLL